MGGNRLGANPEYHLGRFLIGSAHVTTAAPLSAAKVLDYRSGQSHIALGRPRIGSWFLGRRQG